MNQFNNGILLSVDYNIINDSDQNTFDFDVKNVIITNIDGEEIPVLFNDFSINNSITLLGDCNGDESIDLFDILLLIYFIVDELILGDAQLSISDMNLDYDIDILDILLIIDIILYQ